ncbi:FAD-dependent oxidoreductase [Paenisporosarcina indica]|uniref:FAD-dependent oxidoreductase n=1 Tax=Paenisporosarcina indica TaxID=650093 RepID=UPI00094F6E83|nr:FAD-dependent oxidoreductase [Paenisporosarcina indica]
MCALELPKTTKSYWRKKRSNKTFPSMDTDITTEVCIVGAGISGVTAAYVLAKAGVRVTVIEGSKIVSGTTGFTTAKITAQHDVIYDELIQTFGMTQARQYFDANQQALKQIKKWINELSIDCDFEERHAVLYAQTSKGVEQLHTEKSAYDKLGIPGELSTSKNELPFPVSETLTLPNQAQFHPVKYINRLVQEAQKLGVTFYENTRADSLTQGDEILIETTEGKKIYAKNVLVTSHFPFNDKNGLYFSRLSPQRSYAVCVKVPSTELKGMYINVETTSRSIRTAKGDKGESYIIIGGEGHKTGQHDDTTHEYSTVERYETLIQFAKQHFPVESIDTHWSAQDYETLDRLPYIGEMSSGLQNVFVATGFSKWGMTKGTAAGLLLADLAQNKFNPFKDLFLPTRTKMKKEDIKHLVKMNANVAKELVSGKFDRPTDSVEDLNNDEGRIVMMDNQKTGAYKDKNGKLHLVKPTCTHLGCDVHWNDGERSWDCPCHGSRFSYKGEVLEGPAVEPLKRK